MTKGKYIRTEEVKEKYRLAKKNYIPWIKGKKMTIEQRAKISKAMKGKTPWNKGVKGLYQSNRKGKKLGPNLNQSKEKHWNWKGGITHENKIIRKSIEYKLWTDACFSRDGYTCQKYKTKGGKLVVHHILNFSSNKELRFAIDNGITLSKKAHDEFHRKYGTKNNNSKQLKEFLNS